MKNTVTAEAHVLDRVMHLLEERSVTHLMQHDRTFAEYISNLYTDINTESIKLRSLQSSPAG